MGNCLYGMCGLWARPLDTSYEADLSTGVFSEFVGQMIFVASNHEPRDRKGTVSKPKSKDGTCHKENGSGDLLQDIVS